MGVPEPMTFMEWAESVGGQVAAVEEVQESEDLDDLIARAQVVNDDEELQRIGRAMARAYHAYIVAFIGTLLK